MSTNPVPFRQPIDTDSDAFRLLVRCTADVNAKTRRPGDDRGEMQAALRRIERMPYNPAYVARVARIAGQERPQGLRFDMAAVVIAATLCPSWCDDCTPGDTGLSPWHSGLIATITSKPGDDETTVEVRIERSDTDGVPGQAYVAIREIKAPGMLEFGPEAADELAEALSVARQAVARDRANPEVGVR